MEMVLLILTTGSWVFVTSLQLQKEDNILRCNETMRDCEFNVIRQTMGQEWVIPNERAEFYNTSKVGAFNGSSLKCRRCQNNGLLQINHRTKRGLFPRIKLDTDLKTGLKLRFIYEDGKLSTDAKVHANYKADLNADMSLNMGPLGKVGGAVGVNLKGGGTADINPITSNGLGLHMNMTHGHAAEAVGMGALNVLGTNVASGSGSLGGTLSGTMNSVALIGGQDKILRLEMGGSTAGSVFAETGGRIALKGFTLSGNVIGSGGAHASGFLKLLGRQAKGPNWVLTGRGGGSGGADGGTGWSNQLTIG